MGTAIGKTRVTSVFNKVSGVFFVASFGPGAFPVGSLLLTSGAPVPAVGPDARILPVSGADDCAVHIAAKLREPRPIAVELLNDPEAEAGTLLVVAGSMAKVTVKVRGCKFTRHGCMSSAKSNAGSAHSDESRNQHGIKGIRKGADGGGR
jgi:hypothetical protein